MKHKILTLLFAVMAGVGSVFSQQLITIDGNFSDWDQVPAAKLAQASSSSSEILFNVKFCTDDDNIYYYVEFVDVMSIDVYLNTDGDNSTGLRPYTSAEIGADYLLEAWFDEGILSISFHQHNSSDQESWSFDELTWSSDMSSCDPIELENGHRAIEGYVSISSFLTPITSLQVVVVASDMDWNSSELPEDGTVLNVPIKAAVIPTSGSCGDNLTWELSEGVLTISGTGTMTSTPWILSKKDIQSVVMGDGITAIMANAFAGCTNLTTVNIPSSVVYVGNNAFNGCTGLPVINSIRYADTYLIEAVDKTLSSYTIQENTKWIASNAFNGCSAMSITVPDNVIAIGDMAFYGIANVNYEGTASGEPWGAKVLNGYVDGWFVYSNSAKVVLIYCSPKAEGEIVLPEGLIVIEFNAFLNCQNITNINIPSSVSTIGYGAFVGCTGLPMVDGLRYADTYLVEADYNLTSVVVREGTRWIGDLVFNWHDMIEEISLPESLEFIGESAFSYCGNLRSITIPANVKVIDAAAFMGCVGLTFIRCEALTPPALADGWRDVFEDVDKATPLYVPKASIEAYQAADQWSDFENISAMRVFYYVRFVDWDGTVIDIQDVDEGEAAIAPSDPVRAGYTFIGWDKAFDNITSHITVTAQYVINYDVFFVSHDGVLLKEQTVPANTVATAPSAPTRDGYVFTGWSGDIENVTSRIFSVAQYEPVAPVYTHTVIYKGQGGGVISSDDITLTLPTPPEIDNFTFLRWEVVGGTLDDVIEIQAVYEANDPTSAPSVYTDPSDPAQKLIREGNVYILRGDKTYTIQGQTVK